MDNRRFVKFLVFSLAFVWLWSTLVAPKLFPPQKRILPPADETLTDADPLNDPDAFSDEGAAEKSSTDAQAAADPGIAEPADIAELVIHERKTVTLGSLDPTSGYFLKVELTTTGAAIESVQLTDPQFKDLKDRDKQVQVLGTNTSESRSMTTAVQAIDQQLKPHGLRLETIDWQLTDSSIESAQFGFTAPNGDLRIEKHFRITQIVPEDNDMRNAFRSNPAGYMIEVDVKIVNLSDQVQQVTYELQGPVGVLLENVEHTRKYRDIKIEFLDDDNDLTLTAAGVQELSEEHREEAAALGRSLSDEQVAEKIRESDAWTSVFRYAGVDVQFFAALITLLDDRDPGVQVSDKLIERIWPVLTQEDRRDPSRSDISFRLLSTPVELTSVGTADSEMLHQYSLFVGPKRGELLDTPPLSADRVLDYGSWFGFIARIMHSILSMMYNAGLPYVLAIIGLTAMVRGLLFPLSRKQAISAAKMKDLQPKINELKLKYGDEKEKLAKAQMELWRKHNINPLGGCLPLFLQFPVFIGLYTCLNTAVDLRLARFLWIDNLAAPDAIFRMPFSLPFLGQDFNLLPCITVVLFLVQQKMFMPPPADEQQAAQHKMMNMMTMFFGVMFWHVPAGLCVYFIASSLWGLAERKFLGNTSTSTDEEASVVDVTDLSDADKKDRSKKVRKDQNGISRTSNDAKPKPEGFFQKLMTAAAEAQRKAEKTKQKEVTARKKRK